MAGPNNVEGPASEERTASNNNTDAQMEGATGVMQLCVVGSD